MFRRLQQAAWIALFLAVVSGFGFAVWSASKFSGPPKNTYPESRSSNATNPENEKHHSGKTLLELWALTWEDPIAFLTFWSVVSTFVLASSTLALWLVTWRSGIRQSRDMRDAIAAAQDANEISRKSIVAEQRAWLIVTLRVTGNFVIDREGGGYIDVSARIMNIGKTPATNAHTDMEILFDYQDAPRAVEAICSKNRGVEAVTWSRLVLPGEYYDRPWGALIFDDIEIDQFGVGNSILPVIVGCVTYQILPDKSVHQTGFVYHLARRGGIAGMGDLLPTNASTLSAAVLCNVGPGGIAD